MKNIIINGETYNGISRIEVATASGKSYFKDEDEIDSSSGGTTESGAIIKTGILDIPSNLTTAQTFTFNHGCPRKPDIVIVYSDFMDVFSESNLPMSGSTMVGTGWDNVSKIKHYTIATTSSYAQGGSSYIKNIEGQLEGTMTVDDTTANIEVTASRKLDARLTYKYVAICL